MNENINQKDIAHDDKWQITMQSQLLARIMVVEQALVNNDKVHDTIIISFGNIDKKIDNIRDQLRESKDLPEVARKVNELEKLVTEVQFNLAESSWIKKIVSGVVGLILLTVMASIITNVVKKDAYPPEITNKLDGIIEKLNNEYKH